MGTFGRPPIFSSVEELQAKIDEYFETGMRKKTMYTKDGMPYEVPVPTITGLALFLGFASRQSLYDLETRQDFSYTIKKARTFIEREYEELLQSGNVTGAIFALKNMGWQDKVASQQLDEHGNPINPNKHSVTYITKKK
jgi:hypothetical protein